MADADNISKPIVDALRGHAYGDDKQVVFRFAACLNMRTNFQIDLSNVRGDLAEDISGAILKGEPVIYVEVGQYSNDLLQFRM